MAGRVPSAAAQEQAFELREQLGEDVLQRVERSMGVWLDRQVWYMARRG